MNIGLDIGAWQARMILKEHGLVYRQSSAMALRGQRVIAIGNEAFDILGRAPRGVTVAYPMRGGEIAREELLAAWISYLLRQSAQAGGTRRARVLIARAPSMQSAQSARIAALAMDAGAISCGTMRTDLLAALGAGLPIAKPRARAVVDIGAGAISATLITRGHVSVCETLPYGMLRADEAIVRMARLQYDLAIGPRSAENIKIALAGAVKGAGLIERVAGMRGASGFPAFVDIAQADVEACLQPMLASIADLCEALLLRADVRALPEIMEDGITLTGGGAQVYGLDKLIAARTGVPCAVASDPQTCTARGLAAVMEAPEAYEALIENRQSVLEKRAPNALRDIGRHERRP